ILGNLRQIWHGAFYKCPFTKVIIPDTVTSLSGEMNPTANGHVFEECSALREVVFENGASSSLSLIPVATFLNCANLTTISDLPNAVNTIHKNAFNGCKALTTITVNNSSSGEVMLPGNLEMMNEYAFSACSSITKITIPSSFEGCDLNRNVFAGCEKLQTVIFEGAPRMIDQFAFTHCDALKTTTVGGDTFVIPEGVQFIGHGAFYDALGLEKVVLPGTLVETFTGSSDGETNYGIDKFAFQACLNLKSVVINSASIQTNKLQTLSSSIFSGCTALELVKIPANITTVGNTLFKGCILLDKITIDTAATSGVVFANGGANVILGQQAFQNCSGLTSIDLTTIKEIGRGTFYYCTGLTTVNIPATVETIQPYAFQNCTALQTASFDSNNQITELPLGIFESCQNLTNVTLSDNVTSIGKYAFYNCYKFNQKNITNGIQQLNSNAFMNCYALVDINLETIQVIADRVFTYTGLQELSIPAGVTQIGDYAFAYCDSLTSIAFESEEGSTVTTTLGANVFSNCNALTSVVITKNITALGVSMFSNCVNLRSVTFEALTDADSSLETISSRAFYGTAITTITLPDSVITIDTWAFAKCTGLVSIQMDGVVTIGHQAFSGCSSLAKTIVGGELKTGFITTDVLTTIGYGAFHNCKALTTLQLGNNVSAIQGHSFLATGLTSAKFAIGGGTWKLYASKEGEKSGTTVYATITINETGDGFTDASTTQTLVDGLTSTTTHTSAHSTRYYVHLYWEKQ
ncbi:MAG: leucine-rich repeat domain-containing protein, partial [Clostridia bacterium]|nr:leucine-rich repeat domain-containing protein [Clostridia bacterium]